MVRVVVSASVRVIVLGLLFWLGLVLVSVLVLGLVFLLLCMLGSGRVRAMVRDRVMVTIRVSV